MATATTKRKKKTEKISVKLGELEGSRHPYLASFILILAIYLTVAMIDFTPYQDFFFKEGLLRDFVQNSNIHSANICGKVGTTFCIVMLSIFGFGSYLFLLFLFIFGLTCLRKKVSAVGILPVISMLFSIVLMSALAALFHMLKDEGMTSTPYFTSGWGGKVGSFLYVELFHPAFRFFGSLIILSIAYGFFFISAISESPKIVVKEISSILFYAPKLIFKCVFACFEWLAACLEKGVAKFQIANQKDDDDEDGADLEIEVAPKKSSKRKSKTVQLEKEDEELDEADEDSEDFSDTDSDNGEPENDEDLDDDIPEKIEELVEAKVKESAPKKTVNKVLQNSVKGVVGVASLDEVLGISEEKKANLEQEIPSVRSLKDVGEFEKDGSPKVEIPEEKPASSLKISVLAAEKYTPPVQEKIRGDYIFPTIDLLSEPKKPEGSLLEKYEEKMAKIISTIETFKVGVSPAEVFPGPVITRYEVRPNTGVRINKILNLEDDIAIALEVPKVRIALTGRGTIGIEVPNSVRQNVCLREIIESKEWNETKAAIPVVMGKDVSGKPVVLDLAKMPHALIAGSTGSGKSVCINGIIASLLYHCTPEDLRFIMVDPKVVELQIYNALPHMLVPVVTDPHKVPAALTWLVNEMMKRYDIFKETGVKNIAGFNAKILKDKEAKKNALEASKELEASLTPEERVGALDSSLSDNAKEVEIPKKKMPYIVCIIDELADLMMVAGKEVEQHIARLTQLARAAGIHLLVATQRPSTDVITGLIKSNLPTRIAFKVSSQIDSRTILDSKGAETLIGWGDMLFIPPGSSDLVRAQGAFVSDGDDSEISRIVEAVAQNGEPEFEESMQEELENAGEDSIDESGDWDDDVTPKAWKVIKENNRASVSFIQRKLRIGYNRAASVMDELEEKGYVGPDKGQGTRDILM